VVVQHVEDTGEAPRHPVLALGVVPPVGRPVGPPRRLVALPESVDGALGVERQADRVSVTNGSDDDSGWVPRNEFHRVVVHEVEHSLDTLELVGPDSRRDAVVIVKGDYRRMDESETLR
jgi:hypothetical protein